MSAAEPTRYAAPAIAFHWITVVLVAIVGTLGLLHDSWPRATQAAWINLHALVGLLLWILVMARLRWRLRHGVPVLPADTGALSRRLSALVHGLLYLLLLLIPVIGIVTFIWHGRVFNFGVFQLDFGVKANPAIFHPTEDVHGYLAYGLFGLIGLHALAALWHYYFRHDQVLQRMLPASGKRSAPAP